MNSLLIMAMIPPQAACFTTDYGTFRITREGTQLWLRPPFSAVSGFYPWELLPAVYATARALADPDTKPDLLVGIQSMLACVGCEIGKDADVDEDAGLAAAERIASAHDVLCYFVPRQSIRNELHAIREMSAEDVGQYCMTKALSTGLSFFHERRSGRPGSHA